MAAVTKHLGFGVTFSTTYEPPFAFARRACRRSTTSPRGGSAGTSSPRYLPNAARNFGLDGEIPHDRRYEIADEYLDVLYKLWEGSWDDDAVIDDRESRRLRPTRRRCATSTTSARRYRVAGPHLRAPVAAAHPGALPGDRLAARAPSSPGGTPRSSSPAGARPRSSARNERRCSEAAVRARPRRRRRQVHRQRGRHRRAHRGGGGRQVAPLPASTRASTATSRTRACRSTSPPPARPDGRARRSRAPDRPLERCAVRCRSTDRRRRCSTASRGWRREPVPRGRHARRWSPTRSSAGSTRTASTASTCASTTRSTRPRTSPSSSCPSCAGAGGCAGDDPATSLRERLFGAATACPTRHIGARYRGGANLGTSTPREAARHGLDASGQRAPAGVA